MKGMMVASDANPRGNVYAGMILKHVDLIAGLVRNDMQDILTL